MTIERNSNKDAAFIVVGMTVEGKYKFLSGYDDRVTAQTAAHECDVHEQALDAKLPEGDKRGMTIEVMPHAQFFALRPDLIPEHGKRLPDAWTAFYIAHPELKAKG